MTIACHRAETVDVDVTGAATTASAVGSLLGPLVAELPPVVQYVHATTEDVAGTGTFDLVPARSGLGLGLARLVGLPGAAGKVPATLVIHRTADPPVERWSRSFGGEPLRSTMCAEGDRLVEDVGRLQLVYVPTGVDGRLEFRHVRTRLRLGIPRSRRRGRPPPLAFLTRLAELRAPVPRWFAPRVTASVGATPAGDQLDVAVTIRAPLVGVLLTYTGRLTPWPREAPAP